MILSSGTAGFASAGKTMVPMHIVDEAALPDPTSPHETRANSVLRPVVFGANDGLVSNLALVMGVAGADPDPAIIVLAGVAGLLAGAFSMGVGEYISVQSQRELLDFQVAFQRKQLREVPDQERNILADIYRERGFTRDEADHFTTRVFADPESAVRLLIFEEVGLDERSIGSPWSAAIGSFLSFTLGAAVPLVPYLVTAGAVAFWFSLGLSLGALGLLGYLISRTTRRDPLYSSARQVVLGGVAAAVTYLVGSFIGAESA
ncbi:MAG: VIT1/CCC1 transporter family protein [Chloroflexota bacterium]|nr:VIT1/CCC1 transporter family protein [Chloroflexota bacterium]